MKLYRLGLLYSNFSYLEIALSVEIVLRRGCEGGHRGDGGVFGIHGALGLVDDELEVVHRRPAFVVRAAANLND